MGVKELFMNGEFVPSERGVISVHTHGFAYGTGSFEGIRGYWNEKNQQVYIFRLREHYERFLRSCKILQISLPYTIDQPIAIRIGRVKRNALLADIYVELIAHNPD